MQAGEDHIDQIQIFNPNITTGVACASYFMYSTRIFF